MADNFEKQVIITVGADTSDLDNKLDEAKGKLDNLGKTDVGAKSVASLKQQLKEATNEALRLQQAGLDNTDAYRAAVKQIAQLRDEQDKLNKVSAAFDPGNRLSAFTGIARGAATAVQGFAGALSAVGVESEDAIQTIARLQGLMAFTDALGSIGDIQDAWQGFIGVIKTSIPAMNGASGAVS